MADIPPGVWQQMDSVLEQQTGVDARWPLRNKLWLWRLATYARYNLFLLADGRIVPVPMVRGWGIVNRAGNDPG